VWKDYPYVDGPFLFPQDEGAHPDSTEEWWYLNGHLTADDGARYDFMVCFFQRGLLTGTLIDLGRGVNINGTHAFGSIYTSMGRLDLRFGASELYQVKGSPFVYELRYHSSEFNLSLRLDTKMRPLIVNGDGIIRMGRGVSYYYALPDIVAAGTLAIGTEEVRVSGTAWMDRQWGHFSPVPDWDWFSIKLDNGMRLLAYKIFQDSGTRPYLTLVSAVDADGETYFINQTVDCCDIILGYNRYWRSPDTLNLYSVGWTLTVPGLELEISVTPSVLGQEVLFPSDSVKGMDRKSFWEGSCSVVGTYKGMPISGQAFAETTHDYGHIGGDLVIRSVEYVKEGDEGRLIIAVDNVGGQSLDGVEVEVIAGDPRHGGEVLAIHHLNDRDNSTSISDSLPFMAMTPIFVTLDMENMMAENNEGNNFMAVTMD
jgi:predicted secreted hydrolase